MAYNPAYFIMTLETLSGNGSYREWVLKTTDAIATVNTDGYVSDGYRKGARNGDKVTVQTYSSLTDGSAPTAVNTCWVVGEDATALTIDLSDGDAATLTDTD